MKRSTLWWVLFLIPLGLFLIVAYWAERTITNSRAKYERTKASILAKGESLDPAELARQTGHEPSTDASQLLAACRDLEEISRKHQIPVFRVASIDEQGRAVPASEQQRALFMDYSRKAPPWKDLEKSYSVLDPGLERIRELAKNSTIEIHPDYRLPLADQVRGGKEFLAAARALYGHAVLGLHSRNAPVVVADIETLLSLSRILRKQTSMASRFTADSLQWYAWDLTWSLLALRFCPDEELESLRAAWKKQYGLDSLDTCLRFERAGMLSMFEGAEPELFPGFRSGESETAVLESFPPFAQYYAWQVFLRYDDGSDYLLRSQRLLEAAARFQQSRRGDALLSETSAIRKDSVPSLPLSTLLLSASTAFLERCVLNQALANLTLTAIALEQFSRKHGVYPETLEVLSPEYLEPLPPDPFDNNSLRYRKNPDGTFLLYSIGRNGEDDFGKPAKLSYKMDVTERMDIVWPTAVAEPLEKETSRPRIVPKKFVRRIAAPTPTPAQWSPQSTP